MDTNKIRKDFPLAQKHIYFDSAAMSLKPRQVTDAVIDYYENMGSVGGRSVHKLALKTNEAYEGARQKIAKFINAEKNEILFTKNTTEGINLISKSFDFNQGDIVLTTDKEHNSNLIPWLVNEKVKHQYVESNKDGTFNIEAFKEKLSKKVKLVSMVHTSNLDGTTVPAREVAEIAHDNGSLVMFDGAQAVPHKKIDMKKIDADFFAFSGHKMLGPTGTGILFGKYNLLENLKPFICGGETVENSRYSSFECAKPPYKFEAGLQNYAGIIGMGAAVDYLSKISLNEISKHEFELNRIITEGLKDKVQLIGPEEPHLRSEIFSFNIEGMSPHDVAMILDESADIMIRSGMHCVHSWFNAHNIAGSARASLYLYNTKEEAETFVEKVKQILELNK